MDGGALSSETLEVFDVEVLGSWMDAQGLPPGGFQDIRELSGGTQNILVGFRRGDTGYVFRRGPRHLRPISNDVMRREARVLGALDGTAVRHPRLIAACPDETVMGGAAFYLMEPVDGFNPSVGLAPLHAGDAAVRREMGLQAACALAELGAVDYRAVGLDGLGRPEGFLERQVTRWIGELESYGRFDGYPGPDIPGVDRVASWLDANRPASFRAGILHGDYHMANLLFSYHGPEVAAIVDWEMCTIGDPLLDLGWLLATWPDAHGSTPAPPSPFTDAGSPATPAELVQRYAEGSDRDLAAINWYVVLACFKLGIVLEGTNARAYAGQAPRATGDLLHAITLGLFERARHVVASN